MNKAMALLSVVIPTMNRPETLRQTLEGMARSSRLPAQIVVVDQSMLPEDRERNQSMLVQCFPGVQTVYIHQQEASLTKARNTGMQACSHEIVVYSDDDVQVYEHTFENVDEIMRDGTVALIAGIDDNTGPSRSPLGYLMGTKSFARRRIGHATRSMLGRYPDHISGQVETQWAMGYFFVIRKPLAEQWGLIWDEKLTSYAYAEDLDYSLTYCHRAKRAGLRCVLDERVRVRHLVTREMRIPSCKSTYMYVINRRYLGYKHRMGWPSRLAMGWCDFWRLAERLAHRQDPQAMWAAMQYAAQHKDDIKKGNLWYDV